MKFSLRNALLAALLSAGLVAGVGTSALAEDGITVGTYAAQEVFNAYAQSSDATAGMAELRGQMQQAQQEGDRQKAMQIQQQMQAEQQKIIAKFGEDVEKILPAIAKEVGVDIVAMEVAYKGADVEEKDLTTEVIAALGGEASKASEPTPNR